jgi:hypothetical protein
MGAVRPFRRWVYMDGVRQALMTDFDHRHQV